LKRCGGHARFAAVVKGRFSAQSDGELRKLEQALASGDADTLHRTAHSLKSMAAYVAADAAMNLARQIEESARAKCLEEVPARLVSLREEIERANQWIGQNPQVEAA
jgi:HPt (histidine-containing phosphotransfer) domain-containing protein